VGRVSRYRTLIIWKATEECKRQKEVFFLLYIFAFCFYSLSAANRLSRYNKININYSLFAAESVIIDTGLKRFIPFNPESSA
jgi:hypothetical protein